MEPKDKDVEVKSQKFDTECLLKVISVIALIILIYHLIAVPVFKINEPPQNAIYWFLLAIFSLIIPYIREITIKDFTLFFREMKDSRQQLKTAANKLEEAQLRFDRTREELVKGYAIYLENLDDEERYKKKVDLTKLYLEGMGMQPEDLAERLKEVVGIECKVTKDITPEVIDAVAKFQEKYNLVVDGIFGYQSYTKLMCIS